MSGITKYPPAALVVDDDYLIQVLCTRALEKIGFQVFAAPSSRKAAELAQLHDHRIALLLVDVVIDAPPLRIADHLVPTKSDGAALLPALQYLCSKALPIQMSAYSKEELEAAGYSIRADHFLQKPFTIGQLRTLVHQCIPSMPGTEPVILPGAPIPWYG